MWCKNFTFSLQKPVVKSPGDKILPDADATVAPKAIGEHNFSPWIGSFLFLPTSVSKLIMQPLPRHSSTFFRWTLLKAWLCNVPVTLKCPHLICLRSTSSPTTPLFTFYFNTTFRCKQEVIRWWDVCVFLPEMPTCLLCVCLTGSVYCEEVSPEISTIPLLPKETGYLYARFNKIRKIRNKDFGDMGRDDFSCQVFLHCSGRSLTTCWTPPLSLSLQFPVTLRRIDLTGNDIAEIDDGAFTNLHNLEELILAENRLTKLPMLPTKLVLFNANFNNLLTSGVKATAFKVSLGGKSLYVGVFPSVFMYLWLWFIKQRISCRFFPQKLTKLAYLYLGNNELKSVPHLPESLHVVHLQVRRFVNHSCWSAVAADSWIHEFHILFSLFSAEQQDISNNGSDILQGEHQLLCADQNGRGEAWWESNRAVKLPVQLHLSEVSPFGLVQLKTTRGRLSHEGVSMQTEIKYIIGNISYIIIFWVSLNSVLNIYVKKNNQI